MIISNVIDLIGSITLVAGAVLIVISRNTKDTIRQQSMLIQAQKERLDLLEEQHIENVKRISELQGSLNSYKELPLQHIADSMEKLALIQESIMETLNKRSRE